MFDVLFIARYFILSYFWQAIQHQSYKIYLVLLRHNIFYRIDSWLSFLSLFFYEMEEKLMLLLVAKKRPLLFKSENIVNFFALNRRFVKSYQTKTQTT